MVMQEAIRDVVCFFEWGITCCAQFIFDISSPGDVVPVKVEDGPFKPCEVISLRTAQSSSRSKFYINVYSADQSIQA